MLRMAIGLLAVLAPLQLLIGDQHGLNTLEHQPTKIAAMEAHWDGSKPGDFHIFAWPDEKAETQSLRDLDPARLLADPHPRLERPVSRPEGRAAAATGRRSCTVFFAFRIMVGDRLLHDRRRRCSARCCGGAAGCSRRAGICWRSAQHLVDRASSP